MSNQPSLFASGTFQVTLQPQPLVAGNSAPLLARMSIEKVFEGDLIANSQGEMLSAGTAVPGSAAYVAIERVTGTLHGRHGSFVLQHQGLMNRGTAQLSVQVVPDSGTDELLGLSGNMNIIREQQQHRYEMHYQFLDSE